MKQPVINALLTAKLGIFLLCIPLMVNRPRAIRDIPVSSEKLRSTSSIKRLIRVTIKGADALAIG